MSRRQSEYSAYLFSCHQTFQVRLGISMLSQLIAYQPHSVTIGHVTCTSVRQDRCPQRSTNLFKYFPVFSGIFRYFLEIYF